MNDSDDELCDAGDSKELEKEMQALKAAAKWLTDRPEMQNRDAGAEAKVIAENGVEVDLRQPRDASGHALSWDDVKRMLESDTATGNTASTSAFAVTKPPCSATMLWSTWTLHNEPLLTECCSGVTSL